MLESLVREFPANDVYKDRLAEALVEIAQLERRTNKADAAIKSYEQAIALLEQLATAKPDDKALAARLEAAKKALAQLRPESPAAEVAASPPPQEGTQPPQPEGAGEPASPPSDQDSAAAKEKPADAGAAPDKPSDQGEPSSEPGSAADGKAAEATADPKAL
jgi:hypothetical protein